MKINRIFIALLFLIYSSIMHAQSITQEGNEWRLNSYDWMSGWFTYGVFKVEGDSLINGITYKKINRYNLDGVFEGVGHLIREDSTQKVFSYSFWNQEEYLIYDFQAEVGDTIQSAFLSFGDTIHAVITAVDSVELNDGSWRKRQTLTTIECNSLGDEYWIEGIGGEVIAFDDVAGLCIADGGNYLNCFHQNGEQLYGPLLGDVCDLILDADDLEEVSIQIFPNPVSEQINIFYPSENFSLGEKFRLVSLDGKTLKEINLLPNQSNYTFSVEGFPSGICFLQYVTHEGIRGVKKVVIH